MSAHYPAEMPLLPRITAPWSQETVAALNTFQACGRMHPFTCGVASQHGALIAKPDGWVCPKTSCAYRQVWAHAFMAQPESWS